MEIGRKDIMPQNCTTDDSCLSACLHKISNKRRSSVSEESSTEALYFGDDTLAVSLLPSNEIDDMGKSWNIRDQLI